jgi:hypothetical protein
LTPKGARVRFDNLSSSDRAILVEVVTRIFAGGGAQAAGDLMQRISSSALRFLKKLHAEEIVSQAVQLWIDAPRSRMARTLRGGLAGAFLPMYRGEAAKQVEAALEDRKPAARVVDVAYQVRR